MGDILHALPAVTALRARHPEVMIGWAIEPQWRGLLAAEGAETRGPTMPVTDQLHIVPAKEWARRPLSARTIEQLRSTRRELRAARYDVCVDLQGAVRSAVLGKLAHAERLIGEEKPREWAARFLFDEAIPTKGTHVIEQAVEVANAVAREELPIMLPWLPVSESAERYCDAQLGALGGKPFVILNPGAGWGAKRWPAERYGEVARELVSLGLRTILNYGPGEQELAQAAQSASDGASELMNCTITELIALTRRARLFIGGDTGPLHLAAALGIPIVAIFGPTDPARNGPYATRSIVLRNPSSATTHARRSQPDQGLMEISVDAVFAAARQLLGTHELQV